MNWGELKLFALQKMFIDGPADAGNDAAVGYLPSMPQVANEALQILSTAGKFIIKSATIVQTATGSAIQRHDMKTLVPDFYNFGSHSIYLDDGSNYGIATDIHKEGTSVIITPGSVSGTYTVYYNAYPQSLTAATADDTELALDPDIAAIIPLYMASQLYKDDDLSLATVWRNEFEAAKELLNPNVPAGPVMKVISRRFKGW